MRRKNKMIFCKKCGYDEKESNLELHHIIPKCIGGSDKDGRVRLCGKCHNIITYAVILKTLWSFVEDKDKCKKKLKENTQKFIGK
jgi:predicted PP-loop superfamily ATPase